MKTNALPYYDDSVNTTGCCPKFNPDGWDAQSLHFENKPFIRATTFGVFHIPINMDRVFKRVFANMEAAGANDPDNVIVLSRDISPWKGEHLFATTKAVEGEESVDLSGDYVTRVFEGPYRKAGRWYDEMGEQVTDSNKRPGKVYFFYTTCPKCAKVYGKNYVIGVAETLPV